MQGHCCAWNRDPFLFKIGVLKEG
jgi:hypothetical protein